MGTRKNSKTVVILREVVRVHFFVDAGQASMTPTALQPPRPQQSHPSEGGEGELVESSSATPSCVRVLPLQQSCRCSLSEVEGRKNRPCALVLRQPLSFGMTIVSVLSSGKVSKWNL